ncbi:hypothetical protein HYDPIDRAFT_27264 [Hydnomerulius pinastri MD-312]|nr:hypothetical protein HYDPIDRAFT_27264 [Hydnomerulius pinastri MD-312]
MTFQSSSLRVAGRQSDLADLHHSSPKLFRKAIPESGLSSTHVKSMYDDSESVKSWINAIYYAGSVIESDDSDVFGSLTFSVHPFRDRGVLSPASEDFDSDSSVSLCFDASAWVSEPPFAAYDDSDESGSTSSHSDDEAQYISIPSDSPWYRPPESESPEQVSAQEFCIGTYPNSCSSDVRQAIAQQEILLNIFHEELRRIIPQGHDAEYDPDWLEDVDADLVLAPVETYEELCWESIVSERSPTCRLTRPLADVPIGFGDVHGAF